MARKAGLIVGSAALAIMAWAVSRSRDTMPSNTPTVPDTVPPTSLQPDDIRSKVIALAKSQIGWQEPSKYWESYPARAGNWCGAFTAWVLRHTGLGNPQPSWRWCLMLPETSDPKPGDIVFFGPPNNHEAVLVSFTDDTVTTIDGNQEIGGMPSGLVREVTRARSKVASFRTIDPLIEAGGAVSV